MALKFREVVIASVARTPIGSFGGSLSSITAPQLGAIAIRAALQKANVDPSQVEECIMGNVLSAGLGQAPARQAAIFAGLDQSTCCTTINKVCSSGMKSIMLAAQSIMLGQRDVIIAGGFESMSNVPYYMEKARNGYKYGHGQITDGVLKDGLWDVYNDFHMGSAGEDCAKRYGFTRENQDDFATESYRRAQAAQSNGALADELTPVTVKTRKGDIQVVEDEEPKKVDFEKMRTLRPAFDKAGTITAANAPSLNDGGCAVLIVSKEYALKHGLSPLAYIRGFADAEKAPIEFPTAPTDAAPKAIAMAGLTQDQIDFWEFNEAFSVVSLSCSKILNLDASKVNVDGGAVAFGHPIGMSGARIVTHLAQVLKQRKGRYGVAGICNGGGGASSIVLEAYNAV
eukprot:TRINITY_DN6386_c1_g1_i1.p1 TRINITY_DN6386_c1_g1~~TRINITY_DN6386_c1_g1_i1.p1  ORF type:complete len:415 (+),score=185.92 TRINITY_DN6386_c1_g1_i1:50-1246(+)